MTILSKMARPGGLSTKVHQASRSFMAGRASSGNVVAASMFRSGSKQASQLRGSLSSQVGSASCALNLLGRTSADPRLGNFTRAFSTEAGEKIEFKAETKKLLDIVAKSLYTDKEVILRTDVMSLR